METTYTVKTNIEFLISKIVHIRIFNERNYNIKVQIFPVSLVLKNIINGY
jgi:hypothetical protein